MISNLDFKKRKLDGEENGAAAASSVAPAPTAGAPPPSSASSAIVPAQAPAIATSPSAEGLHEDNFAVARCNGAGVPDYLTREDARRMVDLLSKEELLDIVTDATLLHCDVLEDVRKHADKELASRKIFVRGLGWDTTSETLKAVFVRFGELEEAIVIFDKTTGKNRGYGFVTFKHMDGAINALKEQSKRVNGRIVVCQLASVGPLSSQNPQDIASRKIYVGNVPLEWPVDDLLNIFAQYGEIEEGPLGLDKQTGRSRGFALFIYKTAEAARLALEEPVKVINGHQLFCKLAVEGLKQRMGGAGQGQPDMQGVSGGVPGPVPSNMQYNAMQYGATAQSLVPMASMYGQNASPSVNTGISSLGNSATNYMQSVSNPPAVNTVVPSPYGTSQGQAMTSGTLGLPSYGSHGASSAYGQQVAPYGGQPGSYSGMGNPVSAYNLGPGLGSSQSSIPPGQLQYSLSSYQSQQQPPLSYQSQQQMSSYPNLQQPAISSTSQGHQTSMPYYGM